MAWHNCESRLRAMASNACPGRVLLVLMRYLNRVNRKNSSSNSDSICETFHAIHLGDLPIV